MKKVKMIFAAFISFIILTSCTITTSSSISEPLSDPFATTVTQKSQTAEEQSAKDMARDYVNSLHLIRFLPDVILDGSEDNIYQYSGGSVNMKFTADYYNKSEIKPELMTLGVSVTLNGIYQNISVNGGEEKEIHIQEFYYDSIEDKYIAPDLNISFDPIISEADKNEKDLALTIFVTYNPHFEVDPEYPVTGSMHLCRSIASYTFVVNTPITNYCGTKIGTGFEQKFITDSLKNEYSNIRSEDNFDSTTITIFDERVICDIELTEEDNVEIGALLTTAVGGKYRVYFLVNGEPVKLSDGTDCIEVDTEQGYLYHLAPVQLIEANAYDTVSANALKCLSDGGELEVIRTDFPFVIMPHEE